MTIIAQRARIPAGRSAYGGRKAKGTRRPPKGLGAVALFPARAKRARTPSAFVRPAYRRRALRRRRLLCWLAPVAAALAVALLIAMPRALGTDGIDVYPLREMPSDASFFYQEDAAWAGDAMGASNKTLGKDGDGIACLDSVISMQHLRVPVPGEVNPGTLNAWLSENGGYDGKGNPLWARISELLGLRMTELGARGDVNARLDELIQREVYPIVRVKRPDNGRDHYVVLTGSVHGEYTIIDPLDPTGTLNTLGLYGNHIYGARAFE